MAAQSSQANNSRSMWTRITLIVAGALWFVWIGIEDQSTIAVLIMAAIVILALLSAGLEQYFLRTNGSQGRRVTVILLSGTLGGLLVTPLAVLLMAVKVSLHNHAVPDFSRLDVIQVLYSTPAWVLGMLMLSAAAALYDRLRSP